jgi:cytochrome oxidase Cu insertion factor (SCO1/SenC/PrrC family)
VDMLADTYEKTGDKSAAEEWRRKADPGILLVDQQAPDFTLVDMDGSRISLAGLKGKVILLNFWAFG